MSNFKFCVYDVSMIVYDVYHQEMMFKVIGIANKLPKHQKNTENYVIFRSFSKNRRKYCWTHSKYVKKYADFEFDIKKILAIDF